MSNTRKLCFAAAMLAVGILLPMAFHAVPNGGAVFAPMHLPVFLAGFVCGPYYGALIGLICPLVSFLFTGMPVAAYLPNMMTELLVYGSVSGLMFRIIKTKHIVLDAYLSLIIAMILGRCVGGAVAYVMFLGGRRNAYSFTAFYTAYFVTCWPAIIIQLAVIPSAVALTKKFKFISEADRVLDPERKRKNAKRQREFFNGLADGWRSDSALTEQRLEYVFEYLNLAEGARVLDAGCGSGVCDGYLLSKNYRVDAIDVSEKMIAKAVANPDLRGVNYAVADFYEYTAAAKYDCIVVFDAYPHFTDKAEFAAKASELLAEDGILYIAFDDSRSNINECHIGTGGKISAPLALPAEEAKKLEEYFYSFLADERDDRYVMIFKKKKSL